MSLTNVIMWTPEKMREAINLNQANELSIHADFNFFWKFNDFKLYLYFSLGYTPYYWLVIPFSFG